MCVVFQLWYRITALSATMYLQQAIIIERNLWQTEYKKNIIIYFTLGVEMTDKEFLLRVLFKGLYNFVRQTLHWQLTGTDN